MKTTTLAALLVLAGASARAADPTPASPPASNPATPAPGTPAAGALAPAVLDRIDEEARAILAATGVPGASIAIVRDDRIVAARAYGLADIATREKLLPDMILPIGSVSKQFTAGLILLLAQSGKLSLDDRVSRYFPELTDAGDITIRMLLEHVSGYEDDWPEDYVTPETAAPTTPLALADDWGRRKLDFPPGTQFQYSNTGYLIAGLIAQKAGGAPFFTQLRARILAPLHLDSAYDFAAHDLPSGAPIGYETWALSPPHPTPHNAPAWEFGDGELAMTASDLARWDIGLLTGATLGKAATASLETEAKLSNGKGTGYGLGVDVDVENGHRVVAHSGEEPGFVSQNTLFPDDREAVVVLTNEDASRAAGMIARAVERIAFGIDAAGNADPKAAQVLSICAGLASGRIDRTLLSPNARAYFSPAAIDAYRASLKRLGPPLGISQTKHEMRAGMMFRLFRVSFARQTVNVTTYEEPDGRLDQFLLFP